MPATFATELTHWDLEPSILALLLIGVVVFVWLQRQPSLATTRGGRWCFGIAIGTLALALLSPLDEIADRYLLTAHMIQHLLLVLVAAPLLARSLPRPLARRLAIHPVLAFALFNVVFSLSHLQVWYEATLVHEPLHVLEHALYISTALVNWLPVLSPAKDRQLAPPLQMLYLFLETLPMFLVGALLSLSDTAVYPFYLRAPRILNLTPVVDQTTAGLLMWIGGSFFYLGALTLVFFKWANREIGLTDPVVEETWQETRLSA
jgi:putative membrane protein